MSKLETHVDIKEAAKLLHLCEDTVSDYLRKGILKGEKHPMWKGCSFPFKWFIPKSELQKYRHPHVYSRHIPDLNEKTRLAMAWIIAAEGTITIDPAHSRNRYGHVIASPYIVVSNTEDDFIKELYKMVGKVGYVSVGRRRTKGYRDIWMWHLKSNEGCLRLLEQIYEYLPIKKEQAQIVMEFCRSRVAHLNKPYTTAEIELIKRVRTLQHRGRQSFDWTVYNKIDRRATKNDNRTSE